MSNPVGTGCAWLAKVLHEVNSISMTANKHSTKSSIWQQNGQSKHPKVA
ncbi:MAG: hypothetical protein NT008_02360 [Methylococcales bacterium]|nr:hypothetical protein [Methylococcales bacterium]